MVLEHNCPQFSIQNIVFLFPPLLTQENFDVALKEPLYLLYFWSYFQTKKFSYFLCMTKTFFQHRNGH